jgi:hypothetical protein
VTHLRKMMLEELQARKITALVLGWVEDSVVRSDSQGAELLRSFGDRWAPFFVTRSLVQDQPDQPTLSMGNGPDCLVVSEARDRAAIHNFEDASFGSSCSVSSLIE